MSRMVRMVPSMVCVVRSMVCMVPSTMCMVPSTVCMVPSMVCVVPSMVCVVPSMVAEVLYPFGLHTLGRDCGGPPFLAVSNNKEPRNNKRVGPADWANCNICQTLEATNSP